MFAGCPLKSSFKSTKPWQTPWTVYLTRFGWSLALRRLPEDTNPPPAHCLSAESAVLDYPVMSRDINIHLSDINDLVFDV